MLSAPESRFVPERAPKNARPVLCAAVAESRAEVGADGNPFVVDRGQQHSLPTASLNSVARSS
jgi:hypothetical protein